MSGPKRNDGQLGALVEGYRAWLVQRGYSPGTIRNMLKEFGQVGRWLAAEGLSAEDVNEESLASFVAARRESGFRRVPSPRALWPLLGFLRQVGAAPVAVQVVTALGELMDGYRSWMIRDQGLAPTTVLRYENTARRFLDQQCQGNGAFTPSALTGTDINVFLLRECASVSSGSAKGRVAELRSILRFLYLQGITEL